MILPIRLQHWIIYCFLLLMISPSALAVYQQGRHQIPTALNLAKASQNPLSRLVGLPFEYNSNFNVGEFDHTQQVLMIKPMYPMILDNGWTFVTRTIIPLFLRQPKLNQGNRQEYGVGDINPQFYLVTPRIGHIMLGAGPTFIIPTATHRSMGRGKWSAGPTAVMVWLQKKIIAGVLVAQVWSFTGRSDRKHVSLFTLQPFFNYNFKHGWFVYTNPIISADWQASRGNRWTLPIGGGIGRVFAMGKQKVRLQAGVYGNVIKPRLAGDWMVQVALTLLFPR